MGGNRYEKYSDPLSKIQKRELKHKEYKPDGEKRHLEIIRYNNEKLIDILCGEFSVFEKSIAKEEILRRLIKNQKRLDNQVHKEKKPKKYRGYNKFKKQQNKNKKHTGSEHIEKYKEFLQNGGDAASCPFD